MMAQSLSEQYTALWFSSPWKSGTEQAAGEVMDALLTCSPYVAVLDKYHDATEARAVAEEQSDVVVFLYQEERLAVFRQFLAEWS